MRRWWAVTVVLLLGCGSVPSPADLSSTKATDPGGMPDIMVDPASDLTVLEHGEPPQIAVNVVVGPDRISVDGVQITFLVGTPLQVEPEQLRGSLIIPLYDKLLEKADQAKPISAALGRPWGVS